MDYVCLACDLGLPSAECTCPPSPAMQEVADKVRKEIERAFQGQTKRRAKVKR